MRMEAAAILMECRNCGKRTVGVILGIALLKLLVVVFFLLPWLGIRLVLRGRKT